MSSEEEFQRYLSGRGFTLVGEKVTPNREWLEAYYASDRWDQAKRAFLSSGRRLRQF